LERRFITADVFTDEFFGGNPLAVFPDGEGLDPELMQRIAAEFNLSETVFVLPPEDSGHTRRLRIFTPAVELPFAGHPTIGAALVLASNGDIDLTGAETDIVFEEGVGPVPVRIDAANGTATFARLTTAALPEQGPRPPALPDLARLLSLDATDLVDDEDHPDAWSAGVPFLFIPVRDLDALGRSRIDIDVWKAILSDAWAPNVVPFTRRTGTAALQLRMRMFAPKMGIAEDPATGAAAAAFAGYLAKRENSDENTLSWTVGQGFEMGRPSYLRIDVDRRDGDTTAVHVGGEAVLVSEGTLHLQE
jgi:trans-2,3-dihydro-3-hydroxyanthranilate isomerase